ncbi:transglycosylase domain-containing protein [Myxococcota bacterium]|nr:transglycosylase domain-containing protein [Myxococcota bacterium]MBU1429694.1 transglycosylase domain-containing protein [Myxococcota bacterium]MBU1896985.1 transglycosylase domain-containing protein [Myxococcota bacterium]
MSASRPPRRPRRPTAWTPTVWTRLARAGALLLTLLSALTILAWVLYGPLTERLARDKLQGLAARLGYGLALGRFVPEDLRGRHLRLEDLRLHDADELLIAEIPQIRVTLKPHGFNLGAIRPQRVAIDKPTLHIQGDGTLKGALRALEALKPAPRATATDPEAPRREIPEIHIRGGRLIDHAGGLQLREGDLTYKAGRIEGSVQITQPKLGRCRFEGDLSGLAIACDEALRYPLPGGAIAVARALEIQRRPVFSARLRDLHIEVGAKARGLLALLSGLSADIAARRGAEEGEPWVIDLSLKLPAGGEVEAHGTADRRRVALSAEIVGFPLSAAYAGAEGEANTTLSLELDLPQRRARLEGVTRLSQATITHPSLAEGPVGPLDLRLGGRVEAQISQGGGVRVTISEGMLKAGDLPLHFEGRFEKGAHVEVEAKLRADGDVPAATLLSALPPGLLPHLQPITARGKLRIAGHVKIDMSNLKDTILDVDLNLRRLEIQRINEAIDLEALRHEFTTTFEMPGEDEPPLTRVTGPETERWVPLEEIPPLLQEAIIAQEDGGFYKHKGVSLFHLRGSLIRNLERGHFVRGGSTLTMQLAKNLFLTRTKTLSRKLEELILTWLLEEAFEKDELMALYVNVVEFGPDVFGIKEAAAYYFNKLPHDLTPTEIAFLVRLLPGPRAFHKEFERKQLSKGWIKRVDRLLKLLVKRGHLSEEEYAEADPGALWADQR